MFVLFSRTGEICLVFRKLYPNTKKRAIGLGVFSHTCNGPMKTKNNSASAVIVIPTDSARMVKEYEDHSLTQLRIAGFRITMPRVQVIQALGDAETALSPYQIHQKILGKGGRIDVVSVYRILNTLQELGLVHYIGATDGYYPARQGTPDYKSVTHLVDPESGEVTEITISSTAFNTILEDARKAGFNAKTVKIEVVGTSK